MSEWVHFNAEVTFEKDMIESELPEFSANDNFTTDRFIWAKNEGVGSKVWGVMGDIRYTSDPSIVTDWFLYIVDYYDCSVDAWIGSEGYFPPQHEFEFTLKRIFKES